MHILFVFISILYSYEYMYICNYEIYILLYKFVYMYNSLNEYS